MSNNRVYGKQRDDERVDPANGSGTLNAARADCITESAGHCKPSPLFRDT
jgi:hypothetical protein